MPVSAEDRERRRQAIRTFTRLATNVGTPERLNRDAPKDVVEAFLGNLVPALQTAEEIDELKAAVAMWNGAGSGLFVPDIPALPGDSERQAHGGVKQRRVHCADVQLTFNHDFLGGASVIRLTAGV